MAARMGLIVAAIVCLTTGTKAWAQATAPVSSGHAGVSVVAPDSMIVPRLGDAARLEGIRLAASGTVRRRQSSSGAAQYRAVKWAALIGAIAGVAVGALQPTHSNGEYVLGNNRFTSTLVLGGIGAGAGALVGLAIEKSRK